MQAYRRIDDPKWLADVVRLLGRAFLAMLARLERLHRLGPSSEVRNLGLIMSLFVKMWRGMPTVYTVEGSKEETVECRAQDGSMTTYTFDLAEVDAYIIGYAERHSITLHGVSHEEEDIVHPLPPPMPEDPWNTAEAFRKYEKKHGRVRSSFVPVDQPTIGSDEYDITTWDPARRKEASLTGRDPFSPRELIALRMGMTMQIA
jgi:hypothetical protein